jgi:hypothetical protein
MIHQATNQPSNKPTKQQTNQATNNKTWKWKNYCALCKIFHACHMNDSMVLHTMK